MSTHTNENFLDELILLQCFYGCYGCMDFRIFILFCHIYKKYVILFSTWTVSIRVKRSRKSGMQFFKGLVQILLHTKNVYFVRFFSKIEQQSTPYMSLTKHNNRVQIKQMSITECKPILKFCRSNIVLKVETHYPFETKTALIMLSRNIFHSMLYVV